MCSGARRCRPFSLSWGFLSNRKEEKLLDNRTYRNRLIRAIEASIVEFDKKQQEAMKKGS